MQVARRLTQAILGLITLLALIVGVNESPKPVEFAIWCIVVGGGLILLAGWVFADKKSD